MRREVRATANRLANFDDANLRRSARAAVAAGARVERALEILGDEVPDHLKLAGALRLEHKQASLEELGQLHDPPLTKDAIAGRIRRLLAMADKRAAGARHPRHRGQPDPGDARRRRRERASDPHVPRTGRSAVPRAPGRVGVTPVRRGVPTLTASRRPCRDRPRRHQRLRPDRPQLLPRRAWPPAPTSRSSPSTTSTDNETLAHLLKYDSILGRLAADVSVVDGGIKVGDKTIKVLAERDPADLPWGDLGVDVVIESTGFFTDATKAQGAPRRRRQEGHHLRAGHERGRHRRDGRQRRRLRPGDAHDHLQRVLHHQLPRRRWPRCSTTSSASSRA